MVITTKYILMERKDITQVIHDSDDDWQFLSNDDVTESDALVVSIEQIIDYDDSIKDLLNLPKNKIAHRSDKNNNWIINNLE